MGIRNSRSKPKGTIRASMRESVFLLWQGCRHARFPPAAREDLGPLDSHGALGAGGVAGTVLVVGGDRADGAARAQRGTDAGAAAVPHRLGPLGLGYRPLHPLPALAGRGAVPSAPHDTAGSRYRD